MQHSIQARTCPAPGRREGHLGICPSPFFPSFVSCEPLTDTLPTTVCRTRAQGVATGVRRPHNTKSLSAAKAGASPLRARSTDSQPPRRRHSLTGGCGCLLCGPHICIHSALAGGQPVGCILVIRAALAAGLSTSYAENKQAGARKRTSRDANSYVFSPLAAVNNCRLCAGFSISPFWFPCLWASSSKTCMPSNPLRLHTAGSIFAGVSGAASAPIDSCQRKSRRVSYLVGEAPMVVICRRRQWYGGQGTQRERQAGREGRTKIVVCIGSSY